MILSESAGIGVMPPFADLGGSAVRLNFLEAELRYKFFVTYFDRVLAIPFNPTLPNGKLLTSSELEQVLVSQEIIGLCRFPRLEQKGGFDVDLMKDYATTAFELLNDGVNSFAIAPPIEAGGSDDVPVNAIVLALEKCLPCPGVDVPVTDLLQFKTSHAKELARLRHELTFIQSSLAGHPTTAERNRLFVDRLSYCVEDITKAFERSGFNWFKPDVEFAFRLPIGLVAASISSDPFIGTIAGILASSLSVKLFSSKLSRPGNMYPANFQVLLKGLEEGVFTSSPQKRSGEFDIDLTLLNNSLELTYPSRITKPRPDRSDSSYTGCTTG